MKKYQYVVICVLGLLALPSLSSIPKAATILPTRIDIDQNSGVIKFYVNNELAAVLKEDGLHVQNSIQYGGVITDNNKHSLDVDRKAIVEKKGDGNAE